MTTPTVDRAIAIVQRIESLNADTGRLEAVALGLVDALLAGDERALAAALDALRGARSRLEAGDALAGWVDALITVAHSGLERGPGDPAVARGTQAHDFLSALAGLRRLGGAELRRLLETDETQVSRTGHRLLELGLVTRRKVGRHVFWELAPRGLRALEEAPVPSANADFWEQALGRGFDAASADRPGPRREVDPTRERIVESALELHNTQGIQETTWPQIAEEAAVPLETVEAMFPTLDALVRGCGQHFMEQLRLPPGNRAPEVFAGIKSKDQRIRRMTDVFFAAYGRGADGITAARRERAEVPALDESMRVLETAFDSLVVEALRPAHVDRSAVASVRALTDVEVWRTLWSRGAKADAAVEEASATVERWLEAHAVR